MYLLQEHPCYKSQTWLAATVAAAAPAAAATCAHNRCSNDTPTRTCLDRTRYSHACYGWTCCCCCTCRCCLPLALKMHTLLLQQHPYTHLLGKHPVQPRLLWLLLLLPVAAAEIQAAAGSGAKQGCIGPASGPGHSCNFCSLQPQWRDTWVVDINTCIPVEPVATALEQLVPTNQ